MSISPGTRLGVYEVLGPIGAGGMGEVYRARDTLLHREVAIKVLPEAFASDPERLARFIREAQTLAALNHPHIAIVHGLEQAGAIQALVMELVEGEDLSQRLARGAIPTDEALAIAKQIAEALEAAHEQSIIHRDLKPANIKVRDDGTVKVLDFGLAKALEQAPGSGPHASGDLSHSPTITSPALMTGAGMILGTAAYMSPEQAKGRPADKRSDVWAFGCVLYEMLTGTRAFAGEDVSDTLAAVLRGEPDWRALPIAVPGAIRKLLRRALEKDRKKRLADMADARLEIDEALATPAEGTATVQGRPGVRSWPSLWIAATAALVVALVGVLGVWAPWRQATSPAVMRLEVGLGADASLANTQFGAAAILSPDGQMLAFVAQASAGEASQLYVRRLDQLTATRLSGTDGASSPFFSPDGQWIAFFAAGQLKKISTTGGAAVTLCDAAVPRGGIWAADGTIVFQPIGGTGNLVKVSSAGGTPEPLLALMDGEVTQRWPQMLPGGQAVLFTSHTATGGSYEGASIVVQSLPNGPRKILQRGGYYARYVASGHLVYIHEGTLFAVPFDLDRLEVMGQPAPVLEGVTTGVTNAAAQFAVSENGTLVYLTGGDVSALAPRTLVWVDRQSRETPLGAPPRPYLYPRLSPDGTRVVVHTLEQERDLWVWNLARTTMTRLTSDPGTDSFPLWTPDSRRVLFGSGRAGGVMNLYVQPADGTGSATRLSESLNGQNPTSITPDGTRVLFNEVTPTQARDVRMLTLAPTPRVESLVATGFEERGGIVSPDGRWLAYESNSSGRFEIYVRPFPAVGEGLQQVSTAGGVQPLWGQSERELFYVAPDTALMGVSVEARGATWTAGAPVRLLEGRYYLGADIYFSRHYDVTADGQRFLMIKEDQTDADASARIIVVLNWFEELKRLVPVN